MASAYSGDELAFGPDYLIPKPFDPRLIVEVPPRVARAAMESGVATRPIADFDAYRVELTRQIYRTDRTMRPVFAKAREIPKRVVFAEGEEERVLRAAQALIDEGLARPILVGRPAVVSSRLKRLGLRLVEGRDFELTNPESDERFGNTGVFITESPSGAASRPTVPAKWCAPGTR